MIDRDVVRDLEEPARELEFGPIAVDVVQDLDERVLRQVFGQFAIAHHAIDEREDRPLVAANQLAIRRLASLLRERDDVGVREVGEVENGNRLHSRGQDACRCWGALRAFLECPSRRSRRRNVAHEAPRVAVATSAPTCRPCSRRSRRDTISSITCSASTSTVAGGAGRSARCSGSGTPRVSISISAPARWTSPPSWPGKRHFAVASSGRISPSRCCGPGAARCAVSRCTPVTADALALPLPAGSCAGAIVAFGVRNLANLDAGLREVARVLRPGARFVILEFTHPTIGDRSRRLPSVFPSSAPPHRRIDQREQRRVPVSSGIGVAFSSAHRARGAHARGRVSGRDVGFAHVRDRGDSRGRSRLIVWFCAHAFSRPCSDAL